MNEPSYFILTFFVPPQKNDTKTQTESNPNIDIRLGLRSKNGKKRKNTENRIIALANRVNAPVSACRALICFVTHLYAQTRMRAPFAACRRNTAIASAPEWRHPQARDWCRQHPSSCASMRVRARVYASSRLIAHACECIRLHARACECMRMHSIAVFCIRGAYGVHTGCIRGAYGAHTGCIRGVYLELGP